MLPIRDPRVRRIALLLAVAAIAIGLGVLRLSPSARPTPRAESTESHAAPDTDASDPGTRTRSAPADPTALPGADEPATPAAPRRDLDWDEVQGGHTLARHMALSDGQLRDRLRREPRISAASTWTDRVTAETVVAATIEREADRIRAWSGRSGSRPNLALEYHGDGRTPIGRSLARDARDAVPAGDAVVVLRWDTPANRFYVLTAYPEVR